MRKGPHSLQHTDAACSASAARELDSGRRVLFRFTRSTTTTPHALFTHGLSKQTLADVTKMRALGHTLNPESQNIWDHPRLAPG